MASGSVLVVAGKDDVNNPESLYYRLCKLASVNPKITDGPTGGSHTKEFGQILAALFQIGNTKVDQYGDSRMLVRSVDYDTKMLFSDLHRKHIRINELMNTISRITWNEPVNSRAVDQLMETQADLAVYAVRGIQILRRLEEKGMIINGNG
jgi:hypothetical protein